MSQLPSRAFPRTLTLALIAGGLCTPSFATDGATSAAARRGPTLQLTGNGEIELSGDPTRPMLLLGGTYAPGTEDCGRRVDALEVLRIPLDPTGHFRMAEPTTESPLMLQAWQAPLSGEAAGGGYSVPVTVQGTSVPLASAASVGDLVVTEFMKDPSAVADGHGEWIEFYNAKAWRLDIEGITVTDFSGASFVLSNGGLGILLAPGERYVVGNDPDPATNGGVPVDYKWTGFSLKNSNDEILLYGTNGLLVDAVVYDDGARWPDSSGMSISLSDPILDTVSNDDPSLWCHSSSVQGSGGDTGTPGQVNDVCP